MSNDHRGTASAKAASFSAIRIQHSPGHAHSDTMRGRIEELQRTLEKSEELSLVCDQDLKEQLLLLVNEVRLHISELQQKLDGNDTSKSE
jgi:hypothetical protein